MERRLRWLSTARLKQRPPDGEWFIWLLNAGRGFGKTRVGVEECWYRASRYENLRIAVVAPTHSDLKKTVFEGVSGFKCCVPESALLGGEWEVAYNKTDYELRFASGSIIQGFSCESPGRLRGPQFHFAWCDEFGAWDRHKRADTWDNLMFGMRLPEHAPQVIVTTTPKPSPEYKALLTREGRDVVVTRGSSYENRENLSEAYYRIAITPYEGTRLGRQEIEAEYVDDVLGALWTMAVLEGCRRSEMEAKTSWQKTGGFSRVAVGVDPPGSAHGAEAGIVVAAKDSARNGFVLGDYSKRGSPAQWGEAAVLAYDLHAADVIVGEVNNGGDMVEHVVRSAAEAMHRAGTRTSKEINFKSVRASRGKYARAEPIAALYEQGRVFHVSHKDKRLGFPTLEDQLATFVPEGGMSSPDRMDALVWCLSELMLEDVVDLRGVGAGILAASSALMRGGASMPASHEHKNGQAALGGYRFST